MQEDNQKFSASILQRSVRRNIVFLIRFLLLLFCLIFLFSFLFQLIMLYENREFSWITSVYWTLTVMSTLGFGDITFHSDSGRIFTIIVLLTGMFLMLSILPSIFIQFVYTPWMEAQKKAQTPRTLPDDIKGHVIVASSSPIVLNLVDDLKNYGTRCVLLCPDSKTTLDLLDRGYEAVIGEHDLTTTYKNLRLSASSMLIALDTDMRNTNIVFTARDVDANIPIVSSAQNEDSIDILQLAGSSHVFQFHRLLGEALARRVLNTQKRCSIISRFNELILAEAPVMRTFLVGKTLREAGLRNETGVNIVGFWERGKFSLPSPESIFTETMVMLVAGDSQQIESLNKLLGKHDFLTETYQDAPIVILGAGRVGMAAARQLAASKRNYCIVDKAARENLPKENLVIGDAASLDVLEKAGIRSAPCVLITTHDDDTNIYLTLYCRRLRKDIQIISRAALDRNVGILHAAGADLVLSLASMVSNSIINLLAPGKITMLTEGLNVFRSVVGAALAGSDLKSSGIRDKTQCSVVALRDLDKKLQINPKPDHVFVQGEEIILIGDSSAEKAFYAAYGNQNTVS